MKVKGIVDVDPDLPLAGISDDGFHPDEKGSELPSLLGDKGHELKKTLYPNWNHDTTRFPDAITISQHAGRLNGNTGIRIAQTDTGYTNHPEISLLKKEEGYDFRDDDSDAYDRRSTLFEQQGHGTRTASVIIGTDTEIVGDGNNGVFPYVNLIPYRVADSVVLIGTRKHLTRAVRRAVDTGCEIITTSMGSLGGRTWRNLVRWVYENGVIWCCASGNYVGFVVWPAFYPGTIAVGASDINDDPWTWTSRGEKVDLCAPGHNVYVPKTEKMGYTYSYGSGTSYATPHIASAAALWLNHYRDEIEAKYEHQWMRVEAFRTVVKQAVTTPNGWNANKFGSGILNAEKLLSINLPDPADLIHAYGETTIPKANLLTATRPSEPKGLTAEEKEAMYHAWNEFGITKLDVSAISFDADAIRSSFATESQEKRGVVDQNLLTILNLSERI